MNGGGGGEGISQYGHCFVELLCFRILNEKINSKIIQGDAITNFAKKLLIKI